MATSTIKKNISITGIFNHSASEIGGTTGTTFACDWQNYDMLLLCARQYTNTRGTMLIPVSYFATTTHGARPIIRDTIANMSYELYQNGSGSVYAKSSATDSSLSLFVYGITLG